MIIDDSVTMTQDVTVSSGAKITITSTDCIDRQAAGTCFTHKPTFVLYAKAAIAPATQTGGYSFTLMTGDTDVVSTHKPVMTVYVPEKDCEGEARVAGKVGKLAQLDLPGEGVKRYISFKFESENNAAAAVTGGKIEILTVMDAARGL